MKRHYIECGLNKISDYNSKEIILKRNVILTRDGKEAINILMEHLEIKSDDEVYIVSTFSTTYVSKCVTCSIFNYGKPSKVLTPNTKAIYAIHDHGYPLESINTLKRLSKERNIPLIEDCAHSITSLHKNGQSLGINADYIIYSFRKLFATNGGGLQFNNDLTRKPKGTIVDKKISREIFSYWAQAELIHNKRARNYSVLYQKTSDFISPYKLPDEKVSPYCYSIIHSDPLSFQKAFEINSNGEFESATWFGLPIVSFPCHQLLNHKQINDLAGLIKTTTREIPNEVLD